MLLPALLLLSSLQAAGSSVSCLRCRRFGVDLNKVIKNHLLTNVESCASTLEECKDDKCYSVEYVNATTGVRGEVRDCLGQSFLGYWTKGQVSNKLVQKGANRSSIVNWYTCTGDSCNNQQDRLTCQNQTANSSYVIIDETHKATCYKQYTVDTTGCNSSNCSDGEWGDIPDSAASLHIALLLILYTALIVTL